MKSAYGIAAAIALGLGIAWWGGVGRAQQEGIGEKAADKLDEVGRKLKRGIDKAEDAVRDSFNKTRNSVHSMGVHARVYGRLHWDKMLNTSDLSVKVHEGVATLSGRVPSAEAKTHAVTLAAGTVGVTKVVDELTVPASAADRIPGQRP